MERSEPDEFTTLRCLLSQMALQVIQENVRKLVSGRSSLLDISKQISQTGSSDYYETAKLT